MHCIQMESHVLMAEENSIQNLTGVIKPLQQTEQRSPLQETIGAHGARTAFFTNA